MNKVSTDSLPTKGRGIDWSNSIGYSVEFVYDNIEGEIEIIDYVTNSSGSKSLYVRYKEQYTLIPTNSFRNAILKNVIYPGGRIYKYMEDELVCNKFGCIEIMKRTTIKNKNGTASMAYVYRCTLDGNIDIVRESNLARGDGCNVCSGSKVKVGVNDLWSTHPDVASILSNPNEGYIYSRGSNFRVMATCPLCGYEKDVFISSLTRDGFSCNVCSDSISYPEKFITSVLHQVGVDFIKEYYPEWGLRKFYDFYIPSLNCIIEAHGEQHYIDTVFDLEKQRANDKFKESLAKENGVSHYIVIDCSESKKDYIRNSVLNSNLRDILDMPLVDWEKCEKFSISTLVEDVCDLWMSGMRDMIEIGDILKISDQTVRNYLKRGAQLGWCNYDEKKSIARRRKTTKVVCLDTKQLFNSVRDASDYYGLKSSTGISDCCIGRKKSAGKHIETGEPLTWMYYSNMLKEWKITETSETHNEGGLEYQFIKYERIE